MTSFNLFTAAAATVDEILKFMVYRQSSAVHNSQKKKRNCRTKKAADAVEIQ